MIPLLLITFAVAIVWAILMRRSKYKELQRKDARIRMARRRARIVAGKDVSALRTEELTETGEL